MKGPIQARSRLLAGAAVLFLLPTLSAGTIEGRVTSRTKLNDLSGFVVWVEQVEGEFPAPEGPAVIDQKDLKFVPHILVILAGTSVEFPNSDPVSHNVFSISDAKRFNLGLYRSGATRRITFGKPGVIELLCNVHLEMSAYIVVAPNPYFAQANEDGSFRIEGVPAGRRRLHIWHEKLPAFQQTIEIPATGVVRVELDAGS